VSKFSDSILKSNEPAFVTAVLVGGAVLIFPMFVEMASNPAGLCAKGRRGVGNAGPDGDARRGVGGDGSHADATDG
jgi:hypothetical protein